MNLFLRILTALTVPYYLLLAWIKKAPKFPGSFPRTYRWYKQELAGCVSSDGSPYFVYFKKGTVNKTVVYFSGGGLSWNEYTAARPTTIGRLLENKECYYYPFVPYYLELNMTGLLAADDKRNPFNDWNFIYLPYSTADFHIGNHDFPYPKGKTTRILHHHGARNTQKALDAAPRDFFEAEQVMIGGESAGGFSCLAWAPELAPRFKKCEQFIVYSDGAQVCAPVWSGILKETWKAAPDLQNCLQKDGQLTKDLFLRAYESLGGKAVYLQSISPYDGVLIPYENKLNGGPYLLEKPGREQFHANLGNAIRDLSTRIPTYRFFIYNHGKDPKTGATAHTITRTPKNLHGDKTEGISVSEWLRCAIEQVEVKNVGAHFLEGNNQTV